MNWLNCTAHHNHPTLTAQHSHTAPVVVILHHLNTVHHHPWSKGTDLNYKGKKAKIIIIAELKLRRPRLHSMLHRGSIIIQRKPAEDCANAIRHVRSTDDATRSWALLPCYSTQYPLVNPASVKTPGSKKNRAAIPGCKGLCVHIPAHLAEVPT